MKKLLAVLLVLAFLTGCSNNPVNNPVNDRPSTETLIFEQAGLVDSVVAVPGISEITHVTNLGILDYSGGSNLKIKYDYYTDRDSTGIWSNDIALYSEPINIYHSGAFDKVSGYTAVEHIIGYGMGILETKLRLTVYYSCRVISVRNLRIYKY